MPKTKRRKVKLKQLTRGIPPSNPGVLSSKVQSQGNVLDYVSRIRGEVDQELEKLRQKVNKLEYAVHQLEIENDILIRMLVWGRAFKDAVIPPVLRIQKTKDGYRERKLIPGGWTVFTIMYKLMRSKYQLVDPSGKTVGKLMVYHYNHPKEEKPSADSPGK